MQILRDMLGYYNFLWTDEELEFYFNTAASIFKTYQPDVQIQTPIYWGACYYLWDTLIQIWEVTEDGYMLDGEVFFTLAVGREIIGYQEYCLYKFTSACLNPYHSKYLS